MTREKWAFPGLNCRQTRLCLAGTLAEAFAQARATGLGQEDWAVGLYRMSQRRNEKRL